MEWLASPEIWVAFLTLTALEIVLGIDNIIFISILVGRLPPAQQPKARFFGLALAMGTRILLLLSITWVMRLTTDLFHLFGQGISDVYKRQGCRVVFRQLSSVGRIDLAKTRADAGYRSNIRMNFSVRAS